MHWIETIEKYFEDIPSELQAEVRAFLEEYYEKKDTHSADIHTFGNLSDEELENLLYLELKFRDEKPKLLTQKITLCGNLKILSINGPINELDFLTNLTELRILVFHNAEVAICENVFSELSKLLVFSFQENKEILDVSDEISKMNNLLFCLIVKLGNSSSILLNAFPSKLSSSIIYLDVSGHTIKELPDLSKFRNLVYLDLFENRIGSIPPSIKKLKKLRYLNVSINKIKFLPREIFELTKLETLCFSNNQIDSLPDEIFLSPNLEEVWFSQNPYEKMTGVKMIDEIMHNAGFDPDIETSFFQLLKTLNKSTTQPDYNYVTLKIPKSLQTPMLNYFEVFKDYIETTKGKDIIFDVKRDVPCVFLEVVAVD